MSSKIVRDAIPQNCIPIQAKFILHFVAQLRVLHHQRHDIIDRS
jgi:hypothetical protein